MKKRGKKIYFFNNKINKKGQITLFIIIAVVIVALAVLIYLFYPQISSTISGGGKGQDPNAFIQSCTEDNIKDIVENISLQGGSLNPESYYRYNDINMEYLCYTNGDYSLCVVQQPLLQQHIESEIKKTITNQVENCFDELKTSFESNGYKVDLKDGSINVQLLPKKIISTFNYSTTLTKTETQKYDSFIVVLDNNLYELIGIAKSIIEWEATLGEADARIYMSYYPNIKVEKKLMDDGTRLYTITERNTKDKFQFAVRSLFSRPGF